MRRLLLAAVAVLVPIMAFADCGPIGDQEKFFKCVARSQEEHALSVARREKEEALRFQEQMKRWTLEKAEKEKTLVRHYLSRGVLEQDLNAKDHLDEFRYYRESAFGKGYGESVPFSRVQVEREMTRCDAQTKLFYVNDALATHLELYNQCMDLQLSSH